MKTRSPLILVVLICGIGFLAWCFPDPALYVFSGNLFRDSRIITGGALDQPSLHKYLFVFLFFGIPATLFLTFLRVISDLKNSAFKRVFVLLSAVFYCHTISLLAVFTYHVWRYTIAMGVTMPRLVGIAISVGSALLMIRFFFWLWGCEFPVKPFSRIQRTERPN